MDRFEVEQWLALWEPRLLGQPSRAAAELVSAAGLEPRVTHYVTDAGGRGPSVVTLLVGDDGKVRRVSRG